MTDVRFSCVIDGHPLFARQAATFVCTLLCNGGAAPRDIVVHHTSNVAPFVVAAFEAAGVATVPIDPFSESNRYLNKLRQLDTQQLADADIAVLCDCDLAFVRDMRGTLDARGIAAAMVDRPNPPAALWDNILLAAGVGRSRRDVQVRCGPERTVFENRNGGMYAIAGSRVAALADPWGYWAKWLLARTDKLGRYAMHIDQIAFALTCLSQGIDVDPLAADCNVPTHLAPETLPRVNPSVLHYHRHTDMRGLLLPVAVPLIDEAIHLVNTAIEEGRRTHVLDPRLWQIEAHRR